MGHCTVQDLVDRFGEAEIAQLTDREHGTTLDEAVALRAIEDASSEMDSYLASRYRLPLPAAPSAPPVLKVVCADIARYRLYEDKATEEVVKRADDARVWLKDVAKGHAHLDLGPAEAPPVPPGSFQANPRLFTRRTLRDC